MPTYLFSGKNPGGSSITDRIEAQNLPIARQQLELQGFKDLTFHTDDYSARIDKSVKAGHGIEISPDALSPEETVRARQGGGIWDSLWESIKLHRVFWLPLFLCTGWGIYSGPPFGLVDWVVFILTACWFVFFIWNTLPSLVFQALLKACVWHRWREVDWWVGVMRRLKRLMPIPIPDYELDLRQGAGLAIRGQVQAGLNLIKKHQDGPCGRYIYYSRLAGVYEAIRDYPKMLECHQLSVEHGSGKPEEKLDLARAYVRRLQRSNEAENILREIDPSNLSDMLLIFYRYCQGMVAIERNDWQSAEQRLRETLNLSEPYSKNILMGGVRNEITAYLSMALGHLGKFKEARALLQKSERLLHRWKEIELIDRCKAATGSG